MTTGFVPQFTPAYIATLRYKDIRPIGADLEASHPLPELRAGSRTTLLLAITRSTSSWRTANVTLTGVVDSENDLAIAGMRANSVPGVFSVDNDLQVASKTK